MALNQGPKSVLENIKAPATSQAPAAPKK